MNYNWNSKVCQKCYLTGRWIVVLVLHYSSTDKIEKGFE